MCIIDRDQLRLSEPTELCAWRPAPEQQIAPQCQGEGCLSPCHKLRPLPMSQPQQRQVRPPQSPSQQQQVPPPTPPPGQERRRERQVQPPQSPSQQQQVQPPPPPQLPQQHA